MVVIGVKPLDDKRQRGGMSGVLQNKGPGINSAGIFHVLKLELANL